MKRFTTRFLAFLLCALATVSSIAQDSSPFFLGRSANLWVIDAESGRITSISFGRWLEDFVENGSPVYPIAAPQLAFVNALPRSSAQMQAGQPAISVTGLGEADFAFDDPDAGERPLLLAPGGGVFTATTEVQLRVSQALLEEAPYRLSWQVDGSAAESLELSMNSLDIAEALVDGYYVERIYLVNPGARSISAELRNANTNVVVATVQGTYTLNIDPEDSRRDTDGDGLPDVVELDIGINPLVADIDFDADGDGWSEFDEWLRRYCLGSNGLPATDESCLDGDGNPRDTDGDLWSDFDEQLRGTNPFDLTAPTDTGPEPDLSPAVANGVSQAEFCVGTDSFRFDIYIKSPDDPDDPNDWIIFGFSPTTDGFVFGPGSKEIFRVNFSETGEFDTFGPSRLVPPRVETSGSPTTDFWTDGDIESWTLDLLGEGNYRLRGTIALGTVPPVAGTDEIAVVGVRSGPEPQSFGGPYAIITCSGAPGGSVADAARRFKDFPSARSLYEPEYTVPADQVSHSAPPGTTAASVRVTDGRGMALYDSRSLLTLTDIFEAGLSADAIAPRLQSTTVAAALPAGLLPTLRFPAGNDAAAKVFYSGVSSSDDLIYKTWYPRLPEVSAKTMLEDLGAGSWNTPDEWRDAFVGYLGQRLVASADRPVNLGETVLTAQIEGVLSVEAFYNSAGAQPYAASLQTPFAGLSGALEAGQSSLATGPFGLGDVYGELPALNAPGELLAPVAEAITLQLQVGGSARSDLETLRVLLADDASRYALRLAMLPGARSEIAVDLSLLQPGADSDADGISNESEIARPITWVTLPWRGDSDGDGDSDALDPCPRDALDLCTGLGREPTLTLEGDVTIAEPAAGDSLLLVTVRLDRIAGQAVTVSFQTEVTATDSATAGEDFQAVQGTVVIAPGQQVGIIEIPILADAISEAPESFTLRITGVSNASLAGSGELIATVNNTQPGSTIEPPEALVAQSSIDASERDVVALDGSPSTDPQLENLEYLWQQIDNGAPAVALQGSGNAVVNFTAPETIDPLQLLFRLTVINDSGLSDSAEVTVNVAPVDDPPQLTGSITLPLEPGNTLEVRLADLLPFIDEPDGDPIQLVSVSPPSAGEFEALADGFRLGVGSDSVRIGPLPIRPNTLAPVQEGVLVIHDAGATIDPLYFIRSSLLGLGVLQGVGEGQAFNVRTTPGAGDAWTLVGTGSAVTNFYDIDGTIQFNQSTVLSTDTPGRSVVQPFSSELYFCDTTSWTSVAPGDLQPIDTGLGCEDTEQLLSARISASRWCLAQESRVLCADGGGPLAEAFVPPAGTIRALSEVGFQGEQGALMLVADASGRDELYILRDGAAPELLLDLPADPSIQLFVQAFESQPYVLMGNSSQVLVYRLDGDPGAELLLPLPWATVPTQFGHIGDLVREPETSVALWYRQDFATDTRLLLELDLVNETLTVRDSLAGEFDPAVGAYALVVDPEVPAVTYQRPVDIAAGRCDLVDLSRPGYSFPGIACGTVSYRFPYVYFEAFDSATDQRTAYAYASRGLDFALIPVLVLVADSQGNQLSVPVLISVQGGP